jgi:hypothetical protein
MSLLGSHLEHTLIDAAVCVIHRDAVNIVMILNGGDLCSHLF